ncbi:LuxR C-terminal-related transcriptional regulator [Streptomyces sp. NPDC090798]|uniref:LuxR C-terminal-related transcriptional regulator n=1 Tax=Streptomyces sp. NPDC090798 TaxID=3365968 RepID=UPI003806A601
MTHRLESGAGTCPADHAGDAGSGDALFGPGTTRRLIEAFARQHGPARDAAPPDLGVPASREVEVLKLTARGLSNQERAHRLCTSEATVSVRK